MPNSFIKALDPSIAITSTYIDNTYLGEYITDLYYNQIKMRLICGLFE